MYVCVSHSVMSDSLQSDGLQPTRLLCPLNSPVKNTGAGSHSFLQGILSALRWNLGLLHCRQILYHLSHQGSYTHTHTHTKYVYQYTYILFLQQHIIPQDVL